MNALTQRASFGLLIIALGACGSRPLEQHAEKEYEASLLFVRHVDHADQLFAARWDGSAIEQLTSFRAGSTPNDAFYINGATSAPGGSRIALSTTRGVLILNRIDGNTTLLPIDGHAGGPSSGAQFQLWGDIRWSPDGRQMAIAATTFHYAYVPAVHLLAADGGEMSPVSYTGQVVTPKAANSLGPLYAFSFSWSGGGERLIIATDGSVTALRPNQQTLKKIATDHDYPPAFRGGVASSPRGEWLATVKEVDCQQSYRCTDLFMIGTDGTDLRRLTHTETQKAHPIVDPTGQLIAYEVDQAGQAPQIWRVDLNSGRNEKIIDRATAPSR